MRKTMIFNLPNKNIFILLIAVLILIIRFLIGATTEIVGGQYDTDGLAYLVNAGYWGHSQDPIRPPFFPLLGWTVMQSGIPFRLFLEIIFISSAFWLFVLVRKEFGAVVALAGLAVIVFNPYTIRSFTEAQREPVLLVLYIFLFAALLSLFQNIREGKNPYFLAATLSFIFGFIVLTREGEELFSFVIFFSLFLSVFFLFKSIDKKRLTLLFIVMLTPALLLIQAASFLNSHYFGVAGYRGLFAYETRLLNQLHRIKSDDAVRYAPITNSTFMIASQKSAAFAEFGSSITHRSGFYELLREHSSSFVGKLEIDPTRTIWALNKALDDKYGLDGAAKALKLKEAEHELKHLLSSGMLPSHTIALPYPFDPNISHWISYLPSTFFNALRDTILLKGDFSGLGRRSDFNPENFDKAYNRRQALVLNQFEGRMNEVREFIVLNYHWLLGLACLLSLIFPVVKVSKSGTAWLGVISIYLLARAFTTSILFVSVAPVSRYMVFAAPVFAIWLVLFVSWGKSQIHAITAIK